MWVTPLADSEKRGGTGESYDPCILQNSEQYINYENVLCPGHGEGPEVWDVWERMLRARFGLA